MNPNDLLQAFFIDTCPFRITIEPWVSDPLRAYQVDIVHSIFLAFSWGYN